MEDLNSGFNVQRSTFNVGCLHCLPRACRGVIASHSQSDLSAIAGRKALAKAEAIPVLVIAAKADLTGMKGIKGIKPEIWVIA